MSDVKFVALYDEELDLVEELVMYVARAEDDGSLDGLLARLHRARA